MKSLSQGNVKRQGGQYFSRTFQGTIVANAVTIDWNNGNVQYLTLPNSSTTTITFVNPAPGTRLLLILKQAGTSAGLVTWASFGVMRWMAGGTAPTLSIGINKIDECAFVYDDIDSLYLGSFQAY